MKIWKNTLMFCLGGAGYVSLELIWRGRSHGSMFLLGGVCFALIGWLSRRLRRVPLVVQLPLFALVITVLELLTGLAVNQNYAVWDYRDMPFQYRGHICLPYSLLWIPVSFAARQLYRAGERVVGSRGGN